MCVFAHGKHGGHGNVHFSPCVMHLLVASYVQSTTRVSDASFGYRFRITAVLARINTAEDGVAATSARIAGLAYMCPIFRTACR